MKNFLVFAFDKDTEEIVKNFTADPGAVFFDEHMLAGQTVRNGLMGFFLFSIVNLMLS